MEMVKMVTIAHRAGFEHTPPLFQSSMLTITPLRLLDVITMPSLPVYAAPHTDKSVQMATLIVELQ